MHILNCFIFLLLEIVALDAFSTWKVGVGSKVIMKKMHKYAKERNLMKSNLKWIEQRLDNFDENEKRTWKMKYLENLDSFAENGPIYLFIGGESRLVDVSGSLLLAELANDTHGAMFLSEHRYYGDSMPLNDSSTESLKYLSSEQALADLANLIKTIKSQPKFVHSKVVAVGGSYAGNLAAWMRVKYPDIVDCAWASSAPVLAKKDFFEYAEQVGEDYAKYGGKECYETLANKFDAFHKMLQTTDGIEQLKRQQNICEITDMTKPLNKACFFYDVADIWMALAQYGRPFDIKLECKKNLATEQDYSATWNDKSESLRKIASSSIKDQCHDYEFKDQDISEERSWVYQTCTEFGYYQTTDSKNQPFSNEIILDYYTKTCSLYFGPDFNESRVDKAVEYTNKNYGGLNPNVTKVVFVHGSMDPWHRLGITKSLSDDVPAILIDGTSHCRDLFYSHSEDPEGLAKAQEFVKKIIKHWLGLGSAPPMPDNDRNSIV